LTPSVDDGTCSIHSADEFQGHDSVTVADLLQLIVIGFQPQRQGPGTHDRDRQNNREQPIRHAIEKSEWTHHQPSIPSVLKLAGTLITRLQA
jgi:hypothetical protein